MISFFPPQSRKLQTQLILRAEIARMLFAISTLNSGEHKKIHWIKRTFLTKRIPLRLCVSARALNSFPASKRAFSVQILGVCRKSQESMKKPSQSRKLLTQLILKAEIAEFLFEIFTLNSEIHQRNHWIKRTFLTKRIPPRSLRLCVFGVCRKNQESMKKPSQSRGDAEIAELLFEILTLNSKKHQKIHWIKCIFLTKRIPLRSLRLCVSARALNSFPAYAGVLNSEYIKWLA